MKKKHESPICEALYDATQNARLMAATIRRERRDRAKIVRFRGRVNQIIQDIQQDDGITNKQATLHVMADRFCERYQILSHEGKQAVKVAFGSTTGDKPKKG